MEGPHLLAHSEPRAVRELILLSLPPGPPRALPFCRHDELHPVPDPDGSACLRQVVVSVGQDEVLYHPV